MAYRQRCFEEHGDGCFACGDEADVAHHIDGDRTNGDVDNLAPLCYGCHQRIHSEDVDGWDNPRPTLPGPGEEVKSGDTSITLSKWAKQTLNQQREEGVPWSDYLLWLLKLAIDGGETKRGLTTIAVPVEVKERLELRKGQDHHSWADAVRGLLKIVPPADDILDAEACSWEDCDNPLWVPDRPEDRGGIIQWWAHEESGSQMYGNAYYCSPEHAAKQQEKVEEMMPTEPDKIIVGGHEEMRAEIVADGLTFHYGDEPKQIGIPVPGAFGGDHEYVGEPVYVWNAGRVRQSGVISDILHEETHTGLFLAHNPVVEMGNHPDEERRQEWIESYCHWYKQECPECEETLDVNEKMGETIECRECESAIEREPVPKGDIPEPVREWRAG